jgi:hypothetical protein
LTSWGGYGYANYTTTGTISAGTWNYVTFVRNGSSYSWYLNGVQDSSGAFNPFQASSQPLYLMKGITSSTYPGGDAEEFRMSNTARSADWVSTEYNNQSSPATFYRVGAESTSTGSATSVPTTTTGANATATYSANSQTVTLSATVTSTAATVNVGTVTFTVQGTPVTSGTVTNGAATAVYTVPAGTAAGSYPITAVYNASGSFSESSGTASLTVRAASTRTTAANAIADCSASSQPVTLSATVTSAAGTVNAGTVTFTVQGTPVTSGTVTNGAASAVYTLPAGTAAGSYPVTAAYSGSANFASSTDSTHSLTVSAGGSGLSGYGYSRAITISHLKVPNTHQNNFPVLINITDAVLKSVGNGGHVVSASGYDLIFTADGAGSRLLPFERESYNPTTGSAIFWVQVPVLSHSSDTQIYMFYGNPAATDQSNPSGVWDSNYKGVWHLNDDAANTNVADSTSNAHTGTNYADTDKRTVAGEIGGALSYSNGDTDFGASSDFDYAASNFTVSFWLNCPYFNGDGPQGYVGRGQTTGNGMAGPYEGFEIYDATSGYPLSTTKLTFTSWSGYEYANYTTTGAISAGAWNYITFVRNGSSYSWYLNGVQDSSGTFNPFQTSWQPLYLMKGITSSSFPGGNAEEFRMSNTARSADWVTTEYNNQSSPATFYSIGPEQ